MTIYLISSSVRQSGKTTLATNLTAHLSRQGRTILLDIDAKQTAYQWALQSSLNFESEHLIFEPNNADMLKQRLIQLKPHYAHIVIDADGTDSKAFRSLMFLADKMIIPVSSSARDQQHLSEMLQLAIAIKQFNSELQIYIVLNNVKSETDKQEIENTKRLLKNLPTVRFLNSIIYEDEDFKAALESGQSIWQKNAQSAAAFDQFVLELLSPLTESA